MFALIIWQQMAIHWEIRWDIRWETRQGAFCFETATTARASAIAG